MRNKISSFTWGRVYWHFYMKFYQQRVAVRHCIFNFSFVFLNFFFFFAEQNSLNFTSEWINLLNFKKKFLLILEIIFDLIKTLNISIRRQHFYNMIPFKTRKKIFSSFRYRQSVIIEHSCKVSALRTALRIFKLWIHLEAIDTGQIGQPIWARLDAQCTENLSIVCGLSA